MGARALKPQRAAARRAMVVLLAVTPTLVMAVDDAPLKLRLSLGLQQSLASAAVPAAIEGPIGLASRYRPAGDNRCEPEKDRRHQSLDLDLARTLQLALCRSPALRQALARVEELASDRDRVAAGSAPSWRLDLGYGTDVLRTDGAGSTSTRTREASVAVSWVLLDFGQQSASLEAARLELQAAMAAERAEWQNTLQQTLERFTTAVVAWANLKATIEAEAVAQRTAEIAQARHAAGVGSQIDRLQAQTALAQAQLERIRADGEWDSARSVLALNLGAPVDQSLTLTGWETDVLVDSAGPMGRDALADALTQHPRLQSLRSRVQASDLRVAALRAASRGNVVLEASAGRFQDRTTLANDNRGRATAALRATVPLFAGDLNRSQERQVLAQRGGLEAELDALALELAAELWQARQGVDNSRLARQASDRLVQAAEQAYTIAEGRYRAGVGSMLELLNAQTAQVDARRQQALARADAVRQQVRYLLGSGRLGG